MQDTKRLHLKIQRSVDNLLVGTYKTAFKGRGLEFSDYRPYDENDDAKYIDFLASAREGKYLIKRFQEERELGVYFLIDVSESMYFGEEKSKIQTMREVFLLLGLSALKNNDRVGALVFSETGMEFFSAKKSLEHIYKISQYIAHPLFSKQTPQTINATIKFFNSLPIKNALVFVLTDDMQTAQEKNLKILSLKNDTVYVNIFDFFENNLSYDAGVARLKSFTQTFFIHLRQKNKIQEYQELRKQKIKDFGRKLHRLGIDYLFVDNTTNIFSKFLVFFKNR